MSLRTRLFAAFGLVTGIMLVPALYSAARLSQLEGIAVEGRTNHAAAVAHLGRMQGLVADLDRLERSFVATGNTALGDAATAQIDSLNRVYEAFRTSSYGALGAGLDSVIPELVALSSEVGAGVRQGRLDDATERAEHMLERFDAADARFQAIADSVDARARTELASAEAMSVVARQQAVLFGSAALLLALLFTGVTTHGLTAPLRRLGRAMAAVADGVLQTPDDLPLERNDEIGDLSTSFDIMTQRLRALDRNKSEFLGMVSHELKTPINAINAYAELLDEELTEVPDHARDMIHAVGEQARELGRRVSRLMDLSRLEAGTYQLQREDVHVKHFMTDLVNTFRRLAEDKGVSLKVEMCEGTPEDIVMDGDIVRDEVLGNLIVNAIRHTPEDGRVEVVASADGDGIRFLVADTGPGVSEVHRNHIFQKHYMAVRTRAVGSGLGLAIAKEMVELHGGIITLEDPVQGWGARFRVVLPRTGGRADVEIPSPCLVRPENPEPGHLVVA